LIAEKFTSVENLPGIVPSEFDPFYSAEAQV